MPSLFSLAASLGMLFGAISGCVVFPGNELEDIKLQPLPLDMPKPAISFTNLQMTKVAQEAPTVTEEGEPIVKGYILEKTDTFSSTQALPGQADFEFRFVTLQEETSYDWLAKTADTLYLGLSCISLGIIPYIGASPRVLEVTVRQQGKEVRVFQYRDRLQYWSSIVLVPWWRLDDNEQGWARIQTARQSVDERIVDHFIRDFRKNFMTPQAASPHPAPAKHL